MDTYAVQLATVLDRWECFPEDDASAIKVSHSDAQFSKGIYSIEEVRKKMWARGYKCSKNNFHKLLRNPVYIGKIKIQAWGDEPEETVNGLHEPIIEEEIYYQVQDILCGRRIQPHKKKELTTAFL